MSKTAMKQSLGLVVLLGSVWGLAEAGLGLALRACAQHVSGSIMTGAALFFLAATWALTRRVAALAMLVLVVCLFKLFDAFLLSLPVGHGAVANPIFAFAAEGLAFCLVVLIGAGLAVRRMGPSVMGGLSALAAVAVFPLAKLVTGIPVCTYTGTGVPLSWYFAPLAVLLSALTVPAGFWAASRIREADLRLDIVSTAAAAGSLALIAFIRLA